ncbi:uracil-DNA glycosylase [Kiloniella sp. b19]|uniref:uracil-DNA glycosylase n=1 Tax=Kiloniella sp. GXU_MW_B19 TaxID=3141326 RepID=UPI0031D81487
MSEHSPLENLSKDEIAEMLHALQWQQDMGIDENISEEAVNHFELSKQQAEELAQKRKARATPKQLRPIKDMEAAQKAQSLADVVRQAEKLAREAGTLAELKEALEAFEGCSLKKTASHTLFGQGPENPPVMILTGAPRADEDKSGEPVAGKSAELLRRMLIAIGQKREDFYVSPTLFWRPPGDKKATAQDMAVCVPFIKRQIELVSPDVLFLMGEVSVRALLDTETTLLKSRNKWHELQIGSTTIPALTSLSLDHLMNTPRQKALAWEDLKRLRDKIRST